MKNEPNFVCLLNKYIAINLKNIFLKKRIFRFIVLKASKKNYQFIYTHIKKCLLFYFNLIEPLYKCARINEKRYALFVCFNNMKYIYIYICGSL